MNMIAVYFLKGILLHCLVIILLSMVELYTSLIVAKYILKGIFLQCLMVILLLILEELFPL